MKFSIITPTYNRPVELKRAIESVFAQDYFDWEIIIINDSPDYDYSIFENSDLIKNSQIKYFKNPENFGVNYSRNFALGKVLDETDYIIFLDDDDLLSKNSLKDVNAYLENNKNITWLLTNRQILNKDNKDNQEIQNTKIKKIKDQYNYFWDYLIFKNISGDATHIIKKDIAIKYSFSKSIRNGEEWFFFFQLPGKIIYKDLNTTISYGYGELNEGQNKKTMLKNIPKLFLEAIKAFNLKNKFLVIIYLILRFGKQIIR